MRYRLKQSIMVLAFTDNHQLAVTVPAGEIIRVIGGVDNDNRFLVVDVGDERFHIFASDLGDRAEQVLSASHAEPCPSTALHSSSQMPSASIGSENSHQP